MNVEQKLNRMKELKQEIAALEAEFNALKEDVITLHFAENEIYKNEKGILIASYKEQIREMFNTTKFKQDHQDVYKVYSEIKIYKTFLLK